MRSLCGFQDQPLNRVESGHGQFTSAYVARTLRSGWSNSKLRQTKSLLERGNNCRGNRVRSALLKRWQHSCRLLNLSASRRCRTAAGLVMSGCAPIYKNSQCKDGKTGNCSVDLETGCFFDFNPGRKKVDRSTFSARSAAFPNSPTSSKASRIG